MTTKDIRTSHAHTVCDVCGRTLLRGERAEIYINGGARRSVCELCRPRALHEGWVREGTLPDYNQSGSGAERRRSLLNRLRNRRQGRRARPSLDDELAGYETPRRSRFERPRFDDELSEGRWDATEEPWNESPEEGWDAGEEEWGETEEQWAAPDPESHQQPEPYGPGDYEPEGYEPEPYAPADGEDLLDEPPPARRPWSLPPRSLRPEPNPERPSRAARQTRSGARSSRGARRSRPTDPAGESLDRRAQSREPRHVRAVPASQEQKMVAAVELFNQSEHRRTVAGVARSLGGAGVTVLPAAEPPSLVHVVVWWELCWYRYTVDLSDEVPGVRVDGQGYELSELTEAERTANAAADESGQLVLR